MTDCNSHRTTRVYSIAVSLAALAALWSTCADAGLLPVRMRPERGLCAVICGKDASKLPLKLAKSGKVLVHCITPDNATAERMNQEAGAAGLSGTVSAEMLSLNPLPYRDHLLNALIIEDFDHASAAGLTMADVMRAVAPQGLLCFNRGGRWQSTTRERPAEMDDWPQTFRNAGGNRVSDDRLLKFPVGLRWHDGLPFNLRIGIHNANAWTSTRAMVISGGRLFTVSATVTENLRRTHNEMYGAKTGQDLYLTARDAWNGLLLWRHKLGNLFYGGLHYTNRAPLIATEERVFAVTGDRKLIALDAASGKLLQTYDTTYIPGRIMLDRGILVATTWKGGSHIGGRTGVDRRRMEYRVGKGTVEAFDAKTGHKLWSIDALATSIRGADGMVYLAQRGGPDEFEEDWHLRGRKSGKYKKFDKDSGKTLEEQFGPSPSRPEQHLVAVDLMTGKVLWKAGPDVLELKERDHLSVDVAGLGTVVTSRNVYAISRGGSPVESVGFRGRDGKVLFRSRRGALAVIHERGIHVGGEIFDPLTGESRGTEGVNLGRTVCTPQIYVNGIYTRNRSCYYTVDGQTVKFGAARGACMFAAIPANGAFYTCQTFCNCAPGTVPGMISFGPVRNVPSAETMEAAPIAVKGPAFGRTPGEGDSDTCAMYRGGPERNSGTSAASPENLSIQWQKRTSQPLTRGAVVSSWEDSLIASVTAPVSAGKVVVVADSHRHQVVALHAEAGTELWRTTVGGRVVTAPTVYRGLCLFGARDGFVYALDAREGTLAWKMPMGPDGRRMVSYGQVESPWPVFGSIVVADGVAYAAGGRSSESDGGIIVRAFDPLTGEQHWAKAVADVKGRRAEHPSDIVRLFDGVLYVMRSRLDPKTGELLVDPHPEYEQAKRAADAKVKKGEKDVEMPEPPTEVAPYLSGTENLASGHWLRIGSRRFQMGFGKLRGSGTLSWDADLVCAINGGGSVVATDRKTVGPRYGTEAPRTLWTHACDDHAQVTTVVVCKNAVVVGGGLYSSEKESPGFIRVLSRDKGELLSQLRLGAAVVYDGIAVTDGQIVASLADGTVVCCSEAAETARK